MNYYDLDHLDQLEVKGRAVRWSLHHMEHVIRLIQDTSSPNMYSYSYPPSGSDLFHPELWKASHWRWANEEFNWGIKNKKTNIFKRLWDKLFY